VELSLKIFEPWTTKTYAYRKCFHQCEIRELCHNDRIIVSMRHYDAYFYLNQAFKTKDMYFIYYLNYFPFYLKFNINKHRTLDIQFRRLILVFKSKNTFIRIKLMLFQNYSSLIAIKFASSSCYLKPFQEKSFHIRRGDKKWKKKKHIDEVKMYFYFTVLLK
jgi:hypothetical protein